MQISAGLQHGLLVLHRPVHARAARSPGRCEELVDEVARLAADGVARGHAARPERQLLRDAPAAGEALVRRAAARGRRDRRHRAHPLHEPAPVAHGGGRHPLPRRAAARSASTSTCRCRPAPSRVLKRDAPHLHARALPRPGRADPRARARTARSPPTSSSGSRGRPRPTSRETLEVVRGGRLRRRLHVHLLAAPRHRGGRLRRTTCRTRSPSSAWSASSRSSSAAPASAPSASSAARSTCWSRARRAPTRRGCAAASRHNKVVNFAGLAAPGEIVPVDDHRGDVARRSRGEAVAARRRSAEPRRASVRPACEHVFVRWHEPDRQPRTPRPGFPASTTARSTRTFDAPEALDARFHEVRAKSALNRVPGASRVPFALDGQPVPGVLPCLLLLLRPADARVPGVRRGARLRRARSWSRSTRPEVLRGELRRPSWTRRARGAGDEHGPVPVGRGALRADARDPGGAAGRPQPVLRR